MYNIYFAGPKKQKQKNMNKKKKTENDKYR